MYEGAVIVLVQTVQPSEFAERKNDDDENE
jgi:hypothetical protein